MTNTIPAQDKVADAKFAAENGIRIPYIYPTYADAQRAAVLGKTLIARSFHPTELQGFSGVNDSPVIHEGARGGLFEVFHLEDETAFKAAVFEANLHALGRINAFCEHNKLDLDEYLKEIEYSYWEFIPGKNLTVIADPVIEGRYRIFANWKDGDD